MVDGNGAVRVGVSGFACAGTPAGNRVCRSCKDSGRGCSGRHHACVEIVPAEAEYLVRAQINPQDIADVQPGQVARISLSAYDPSRYGVVMGVVRRVASNTTQPENAMPFYETIIAIPEVAFTKSPEQPVITSGMPLQVDILGGKRTVMEYIMTPIQKSLATAFRET